MCTMAFKPPPMIFASIARPCAEDSGIFPCTLLKCQPATHRAIARKKLHALRAIQTLAATALGLGLGEVLLGQHADDQVETVLLALSRGAGLAGIAGMPRHFERHGMAFGRPLLDVGGAQLRAWLQATASFPTSKTPAIAIPHSRATAFGMQCCLRLPKPLPQYRETFSRSARLRQPRSACCRPLRKKI